MRAANGLRLPDNSPRPRNRFATTVLSVAGPRGQLQSGDAIKQYHESDVPRLRSVSRKAESTCPALQATLD